MRFHSKPIQEHPEVPIADNGQLEELIHRWQRREHNMDKKIDKNNNCYVVSVGPSDDGGGQLNEILSLLRTLGDSIVGYETVKVLNPNPRSLIGKGKLTEIAERSLACGANLLVIDAELTPSQMRNLEDIVGIAVCDREAVILNVFMKNAKTKQSKIQVEVAHLKYLRPRIRGLGLDMDQQASGLVTGRGPGETASALLARKLNGRLIELNEALKKIKNTGRIQRVRRKNAAQIKLVGYTNAGKTSLMNALTKAGLSVKDKPFETLDTTTRCLSRHGETVLLSDTVGFIRRLPNRLMESFESTLEGIKEASLLVIVVDISDKEKEMHLQETVTILSKLGALQIPRLYVFTKADLLNTRPSNVRLTKLCQGNAYTLLNSRDEKAISQLRKRLLSLVRSAEQDIQLFVPYGTADITKMIYADCRVTGVKAQKQGLLYKLQGSPSVIAQIKSKLKEVYNA